MAVADDDVQPFLNRIIGVVYTDNNRDFLLKGRLVRVSSKTLSLLSENSGTILLALDSVKKITVDGELK